MAHWVGSADVQRKPQIGPVTFYRVHVFYRSRSHFLQSAVGSRKPHLASTPNSHSRRIDAPNPPARQTTVVARVNRIMKPDDEYISETLGWRNSRILWARSGRTDESGRR